MNFLEELEWRGMVHDAMPGAKEYLEKNMTSGYIGFDPTADSLHVGNLVQIMTLVHFQKCGNKPIALVGGATGMVGDPSGKSAERNLLSEDVLNYNLACVKKQLEKFLDFDCGKQSAEVVNNYDWFKNYSFLDFIRDVGKHITVNYMMAKDSVQKRLESGLSFTEFSYQIVQGFDFYWLWKNRNVMMQMGGSDQWGNIVTGTELIRRIGNGEAYAITTPLITKADGSKFGKTESGNIWLDKDKTSPYSFYQYWLNASDVDVKKYMKIFSLKSREAIELQIEEHNKAPHERKLQKSIAEELTTRVHSSDDFNQAVKASQILFGKSTTDDLKSLDENTLLALFEGVPQTNINRSTLGNGLTATDFLSEITKGLIFKSKGEARRMIKGGGVSINKKKVDSADDKLELELLQNKYILAQKGKKNYFLIRVES